MMIIILVEGGGGGVSFEEKTRVIFSFEGTKYGVLQNVPSPVTPLPLAHLR